jgi:hypothetical protein
MIDDAWDRIGAGLRAPAEYQAVDIQGVDPLTTPLFDPLRPFGLGKMRDAALNGARWASVGAAVALPSLSVPDYPEWVAAMQQAGVSISDNTAMNTIAVPIDKVRISNKPDRSFMTVMVSTTISILFAFFLGRSRLFTPGDNVGYYLGLVGGVMMLLLLLYPVRKYLGFARNWGSVKYWFAVHMFLGICGPVLVLAHSTFHMRSTNAAVALVCMLVVAGSGIVGRFFYTKVHRGLYGEKTTLKDLQSEAGLESEEMHSRLHFAPGVEKELADFQKYALEERGNMLASALRFLTLTLVRLNVERRCRSQLRDTMKGLSQARGWDDDKFARRYEASILLVRAYLNASQRVAQFSVYDRLLQLWHVAHVPLVYLLVISGIAHVVAVHMY